MVQRINDYFASRPVVTGALGATDKIPVLQGGVVKMSSPQYTAVLLDTGGSGKRFQVTVQYLGMADDGVTPILSLNGVEV